MWDRSFYTQREMCPSTTDNIIYYVQVQFYKRIYAGGQKRNKLTKSLLCAQYLYKPRPRQQRHCKHLPSQKTIQLSNQNDYSTLRVQLKCEKGPKWVNCKKDIYN